MCEAYSFAFPYGVLQHTLSFCFIHQALLTSLRSHTSIDT